MIASFSYPLEKDPIVEEFDKIARTEGKDRSKLIVELIEKHVINHQRGNPQHTLDRSIENPGFIAMPTMGEILTPARLGAMSKDELSEMEKASEARKQEIEAELQRRQDKEWGRRTHYPRPPWKD
jgi:hypothetical protein